MSDEFVFVEYEAGKIGRALIVKNPLPAFLDNKYQLPHASIMTSAIQLTTRIKMLIGELAQGDAKALMHLPSQIISPMTVLFDFYRKRKNSLWDLAKKFQPREGLLCNNLTSVYNTHDGKLSWQKIFDQLQAREKIPVNPEELVSLPVMHAEGVVRRFSTDDTRDIADMDRK